MAELPDDDDELETDQSWLATFADLSTLLMCFFVLLYSMAVIDAKRFDATFSSVRNTFGGDEQSSIKTRDIKRDESKTSDEVQKIREDLLAEQQEAYNQIQSFITQQAVSDQISAILDEGKIILRLPSDVVFQKGSELLSPQAEKALYVLLQIFHNRREQHINIKGYSDNTPVPPGSRFYDNWELSALRSVNILRFYINSGIEPFRMTATGLGELDPLFPNDTEEHKTKNRRVEFVLERNVTQK